MDRELQKAYDKGFDWLLMVGPRIILAILLLIIGIWLIRLIRKKVKSSMRRKRVHSSLRPFIESLVYTLLHIALFLIIMQILGVRLTIFAAVIAAFGAAAGLALSGTLQNFASGILILLLKPFKVGDNIIAQNIEGRVSSIQIFYTVITPYDNRTVIMPNSKLSNEVITNVTQQGNRRIEIILSFKKTFDLVRVKQVLIDALATFPDVCEDTPPRVGVTEIGIDDYKVKVNVWVKAHGFEDTRMAVNEHLLQVMEQNLKAEE